jgi:hypothetical protein
MQRPKSWHQRPPQRQPNRQFAAELDDSIAMLPRQHSPARDTQRDDPVEPIRIEFMPFVTFQKLLARHSGMLCEAQKFLFGSPQ